MAGLFLTLREASEALGGRPSVTTLQRLAREGHLPVTRCGRRTLIARVQLERWVEQVGPNVRAKIYPGHELPSRAVDELAIARTLRRAALPHDDGGKPAG